MSTQDDVERALFRNLDFFNEFTINELETIWEHTFQRVDENSGDGITSKFFEYSGATRNGPDVDLGEGEWIRTKERGKYGAGKPATSGAAARFTQAPQGDQDGWIGYYDSGNGIGGGLGYQHFDVGEGDAGGATEAGAQIYAFLERDGEGRTIVPAEQFNLGLPGDFDPTDGFIVRWPHAAYGHVGFLLEVGIKTDWEDADITMAGDAFDLRPVHIFTDLGQTMWSTFDNPIEWNVTGSEANDFTLKATACHYEGKRGRTIKRTSGDGFVPQKNGGSVITLNGFSDWTYLISFRKRTGWESTDVTPLGFSINPSQNIEVQVTVGGDFNDTSYGLPEDTATEEAATEYDIKTWDLAADPPSEKTTDTTIGTTRGRREYHDTIPGDKQDPVTIQSQLDNVVVATDEAVALLARPATGTSTDIRYAALRNGSNF
jgi:hypothetical protein